MGFEFQVLTAGVSEKKLQGIMQLFKKISGGAPWGKIVSAVRFGLAKVNALDEIEKEVHRVRAREKVKGQATAFFQEATKAVDETGDYDSLKRRKQDYLEKLRAVPQDGEDPLLVGVMGEFYVVLEPFSNNDVEIELGKLGVEVRRRNFASRWLRPGVVSSGWKEEAHRAALPYLKRTVGGEGWESVGEKVLHARHLDGLVHLAPFTCMPETIAQNILPSVKQDIPVLTLICDEQTGKQGMLTRLEAFVDLLNRRRQRKKDESLSRC
jgi:predicted nucleotide-binding protein (sugar kinase/HSP70/actin superfamily)